MYLCLLFLEIETHCNSLLSCIHLLNITNDTKLISIKTYSFHTFLQFLLGAVTSSQCQCIQRMSWISLLHDK